MFNQDLAIIVGGSSGMGLEIAKRLAASGLDLLIMGRNEQKLKHAVDELKQIGGKIEYLVTDLYNQAHVSQCVMKIKNETRAIKYLVNAAGYFKPISFLDHTEADYDLQ